MEKVYLTLAILISLLTAGCATIVTKSTYPLSISSTPDEAAFSITDKGGQELYNGTTLETVYLKAGAGFFERAQYQVKFSEPGYKDKTCPVYFKLDGWYFGNLFLPIGGWLGMIVLDPVTGAMWKIESRFLHATLDRNRSDAELKILHINDVPDNLKKHLVKLN
jgi:uncharacterized protein YceK